ncbi:NifB/NifX family molybdenum-iron cluster-binding protein [Fervidobacterium pennivorans subsp. shakshaketiis]|jgi:predicted Fe-Mo cluster-binding NifX family protein|uniref:Dinitrogenase iron-molybdenum cofactor biosynthesis domain-containing protein n=1 Tax=Fervidobacterium pennivorans (strain DSM 9078 / Ven5) TaxID=771875 RepID=H9UEH8_FERPD|nr:NifB/NifX family molybdenum-iron cluster-binding protein [Fervidobacterium pennivorans]AFG35921.1 hypothetical protein Ferpe_1872 [Fervidobacterium pennivorans DSM 9078]QIV78986.1 dinitrogenase iron-molybdenum cofactor biosynthesis protein [Fervidobacterium pennivorans subsp. keratinolyticus]
MKIAIPTDDGRTVASHFGSAEYFMIVEFEDGKEISRRLSENLHARGHGHHGYHEHYEGHGYGHGWHHGNHGYGGGYHHGYGEGHRHGHEEVFASTGEIQAVIAVRIGPHMFEDLKERGIGIYLVRPGTSIDEAIAKFTAGELRKIEPRK